MRTITTTFLFFVCACGGGVDCSKEDRTGTYLVSYDEREGGQCGPVTDQLAQLSDGDPVTDDNCIVEFERWSDDMCDLERSVACEHQEDDILGTSEGVTTQEDDEGEHLVGVATVTLKRLSTDETLCTSTYDLKFERQ